MLSPYIPNFGSSRLKRKIVDWIPDKNVQRLKAIVDIMYKRSQQIFQDKLAASKGGDAAAKLQIGEGKDIMSILRTYSLFTYARRTN